MTHRRLFPLVWPAAEAKRAAYTSTLCEIISSKWRPKKSRHTRTSAKLENVSLVAERRNRALGDFP